jgi:predicted PurR-regulated permease PerM
VPVEWVYGRTSPDEEAGVPDVTPGDDSRPDAPAGSPEDPARSPSPLTRADAGSGTSAAAGTAADGAATRRDGALDGDVEGEESSDADAPDPLTDMDQRRREAGADEYNPFGVPGRPLARAHPFLFGFVGALGVFTAWALILAISNARQVLILILVALFLAIGLNPAVESLTRMGISRKWGVTIVFLATVTFFVGFGFAIVPPLTEQITGFIDKAPDYLTQLLNNKRIHELDQRYQAVSKLKKTITEPSFGKQALGGLVGVGRIVLNGIFSTLTVLILTLYFLSSLPGLKSFAYRLAPRSRRARVALLSDEILTRIGGYVGGNIVISIIAGLATYIFLLAVDVPYPIALALLVAITDLIPLVGATLGAILVTAVAFFSGLWVGVVTGVFFIVYQQVENYFIAPRVMKRSVDVPPAVTIIAALIGGALLGVVGALLAIPLAAGISLILREVVMPRQENA